MLLSCGDDISNKKYRNSKFAFQKVDGKRGIWIKVRSNSETEFPKSKTTYFFDNGNRYAELIILDSFSNRITKFYDTNDKLLVTESYSNDSLKLKNYIDGDYKGYYSNTGELKSEGKVMDNKLEGLWTYYNQDGKTVNQTIEFRNNFFHGYRKDFYGNGQIKALISYNKGKKNGEAIYYYENGQIKERKTFKNSKENGKLVKYFEDGSIQYSGNFWNGKEIDSCISYYANGQVRQLFTFTIDTTQTNFKGKLFTYYESGISKSTFEILNWQPDGKAEFFDKKGIWKKSITYQNGIPLDSIVK